MRHGPRIQFGGRHKRPERDDQRHDQQRKPEPDRLHGRLQAVAQRRHQQHQQSGLADPERQHQVHRKQRGQPADDAVNDPVLLPEVGG